MLTQNYAFDFNHAANEINRLSYVHFVGGGDDEAEKKLKETSENMHVLHCGMCPTTAFCTPVTYVCLNCNDGTVLCEDCLDSVHSRLPAFKAHKVVSIEEDPSILCRLKSNPKKKTEFCSLHKCKTRNIFCNTCTFPICSNCVSDGTHSGHKLSSMEATVQKLRDDLRETLNLFQALSTRIESSASIVRERIDTLKSSANLASETLSERRRDLQLAMESKAAKAKKGMEVHSAVTSKEFEGHLDVLDIKSASCRRSIAVAGRLLFSEAFKCHRDAYYGFKELRAPLERIRDQSALVSAEKRTVSINLPHKLEEAFVFSKITSALAVSIDYGRVDLHAHGIRSENPYGTLVVQPNKKYPDGLLIATNYRNNLVEVLNARYMGVITSFGANGPIGLAMLPASEEFPDGLLYLSEHNGNRVRVINMSSWKEYKIVEEKFNKPWGLAVVPPCKQNQNGVLIVSDYMNHCIKLFDAITCKPKGTIGNIGIIGTADGTFNGPSCLALVLPEQNSKGKCSLYVAENYNNRVQVFDLITQRHELTIKSPTNSTVPGKMRCWGIAVQTPTPTDADGAVYVADWAMGGGGCVRVFSATDGKYKGHIEGTENKEVTGVSICFDSDEKCQVLVSSLRQSQIMVYKQASYKIKA